MVEVMKFQAGGLMDDGHSNNMPTAKQGFFDEEEDDNLKSNDLWDDSKDNGGQPQAVCPALSP